MNKIDKFHKLGVDMLAFNIKRPRAKSYEARVRIWLKRSGVVSAYANGFSLEKTMKDIVDRAYNEVKEKKEKAYSGRNKSERQYDEEA